MIRLRYAAFVVLDWLDAYVLRHSLHRWGVCDWIAWHPWWGTRPRCRAAARSGGSDRGEG